MVTNTYSPTIAALVGQENYQYQINFDFIDEDSIQVEVFEEYSNRIKLGKDTDYEIVYDIYSKKYSVKIFSDLTANYSSYIISRNTPINQNMDTSSAFPLNRELLETALDKITLMIQDIDFYARESTPQISLIEDMDNKICKIAYVDANGVTVESINFFGEKGDPGESIQWKGEFDTAPENPSLNWAYKNTLDRISYIYNGLEWEPMNKDGISIIWKGSLPAAPENPEHNWSYRNTTDGNSYVYNINTWELMNKDGTYSCITVTLNDGDTYKLVAQKTTIKMNDTVGNKSITIEPHDEDGAWCAIYTDGDNQINVSGSGVGADVYARKSYPVRLEVAFGILVQIKEGFNSLEVAEIVKSYWFDNVQYNAGDPVVHNGRSWTALENNINSEPGVGSSWYKVPFTYSGSGSFSDTALEAKTINHTFNNGTDYQVQITLTCITEGKLGDFYVLNKTETSFDVAKTGSLPGATFDYTLTKG